MPTLPPEIRVLEDFPGEVRFLLPRRSMVRGLVLVVPGAMLIGFGFFCWYVVAPAPMGPGDLFFSMPILFFGTIGVLILLPALATLLLRNEVRIADGVLIFRTGFGPFGWSRRMDAERLGRFTVTNPRVKPHQASCTGARPLPTDLATLTAEAEDGQKIVVARRQRRAILEPLADELSARCEALRGGRLVRSTHIRQVPGKNAALARPAAVLEGVDEASAWLPAGDLSDRPGDILRYRLEVGTSRGCMLGALVGFALLWNGVISVFVYLVVQDHLRGHPDWFATVFLIPFVVIGLVVIAATFGQLLMIVAIGPTRAEIAAHPLHAGESTEMYVVQPGRLIRRVNGLMVTLDCEEKATYRQGTDTRTETKTVESQELQAVGPIEAFAGVPLEARFLVCVPEGAMHSFKGKHNEIAWKLVVRADVPLWPNVKTEFKLVVAPPVPEGQRS